MVLVHMGTNQVFELNRTGARIWELLTGGIGGGQLLAALTEEFEVDGDRIRGEVETILSELLSEGLVTPD